MGDSNSKKRGELQWHMNTITDRVLSAQNRPSSDAVKDIMRIINETNQCAVESILHCLEGKKDISKNPQLFDLVQEYFTNSFHMSALCNALHDCLKRTHDRQLFLRYALELFKQEADSNGINNNKYQNALEELKKFKNVEDPFTEFSQILKQVCEQQQSMVNKLMLHHKKIKKKLRIHNAWWILSNLIVLLGLATLVICQVLDVFGLPVILEVVVEVIFSLSTLGTSTMESYFKDKKGKLKREEVLISTMKMRALNELHELSEIGVLVDGLEKQLLSLIHNSEVALEGDEAVKLGFEEIEKSMDNFTQTLEKLAKHAEKCSENLRSGRLEIQDKIKNIAK